MIDQVNIWDYRSLGAVAVGLGRLTVLVGTNGSGKSNFVDALNFLSDALQVQLEPCVTARSGYRQLSRWSGGRPRDIVIALNIKIDALPSTYSIRLSPSASLGFSVKWEYCYSPSGGEKHEAATLDYPSDWLKKTKIPLYSQLNAKISAGLGYFFTTEGTWRTKPSGFSIPMDTWPDPPSDDLILRSLGVFPPYKKIFDYLRGVRSYDFLPERLRTPRPLTKGQALLETGDNLASVLREDFPEGSEARILLCNAFSAIVDGAIDFRVRNAGSRLVIEVGHRQPGGKEHYFDAAVESDGTLRILGLLAALYQKRRPSLTIIEEPELHLQPGAMGVLVEVLREASERGQILVTTQSADLMNELESDELRVVEKVDGVTHIGPVDDEHRKRVEMELFKPGDLIRVRGFRRKAS